MTHGTPADATVLVADDDASARRALARVLHSAGYLVEACAGVPELLARLPPAAVPCCVVSVLRTAGVDGLALQEELRSRDRSASLIFLTGLADIRSVVLAMKGGAADLLQKPVPREVLLATVAIAVERARQEAASRRTMDELRSRYQTLTCRERQVFALVTTGLLNRHVGVALGTSEKTVKVQRARAIEKMGARSIPELVRMADLLEIAVPEPQPDRGRAALVTAAAASSA